MTAQRRRTKKAKSSHLHVRMTEAERAEADELAGLMRMDASKAVRLLISQELQARKSKARR